MSYKVDYYTLAIMDDGSNGNIKMGDGTIYTGKNLAAIPVLLDEYLKNSKLSSVITSIVKVDGECLN